MSFFQSSHQEIRWISSQKDSLKLRAQWVYRPNQQIKKVLIFFNGRSEWIEKYNSAIDRLFTEDYQACLTMDYRGQGKSEGPRGMVTDGYQDYVTDFQSVIQTLGLDKSVELHVVCHSMGSLIALNCILQSVLQPSRLVLCSPLLGLSLKPIPDFVSKFIIRSIYFGGLGWAKSGAGRYDKHAFVGNKLTHSKELFEKGADEVLRTGAAKFSWIKHTLDACDRVQDRDFLSKWQIPTLILVGTEERVVEVSAIEKWFRSLLNLGKTMVDLKYIAGARHELLNESDAYRERALFEIKEFLKG